MTTTIDKQLTELKELVETKNNTQMTVVKKGELKMDNRNVITSEALVDTLKANLGAYVVQSERISLSPSGLAVDGMVWSKKEGMLLNVEGTNIVKDIPVGFKVPTDASNVDVEDIVFDDNGVALIVIEKKKQKGNNGYRITAIEPSTSREVIVTPSKDLMGNQTYEKLVTPFTYDMGCNPVLNMATLTGSAYFEDGIDGVVNKLTPQLFRMSSKMNISELLKNKQLQFIAPAVVVAFTFLKQNRIDLSEFKDKSKKITDKFKIDKKVMLIALLVIATIIYFNKDKIAEKLMSEKIKTIPVVGKLAEPISKVLIKLPNIKNKMAELFTKKLGE